MDHWWVRCGKCFAFSSPVSSTFICLTSCGHFVCNHCLQQCPLPKPANTGYCYDCKKPCSVVNLSQGDKLSPDIAFYFKDPISLFQKIIEIENFQRLHRNRCVEDAVKKRYIDDIMKMRAIRMRSEKYLPYLREIHSGLCAKYGIQPSNQTPNYTPTEIDAFVNELKEALRQQSQGTPSTGHSMDTDEAALCRSNKSTPMVQGSPAGSTRSCVGGMTRGTPRTLFRAHVQSEMRGDGGPMSAMRRATPIGAVAQHSGSSGKLTPQSGRRITPVGLQRGQTTSPTSAGGSRGRVTPTGSQCGIQVTPTGSQYEIHATPTGSQYRVRTTPNSGNKSKPSPLLSSSKAISSRAFSPQHFRGQPHVPHYPQHCASGGHVMSRPNPSLTLQPPPPPMSAAAPSTRQVMLSSRPPQVGGGATPLWPRPLATPMGLGQRPLATPVGLGARSFPMPMGTGLRPVPTSARDSARVMLSSVNTKMPQH